MAKIILFLILICTNLYSYAQVTLQRDTILMGSTFSITIVDVDSLQANKHIDLAIDEIIRIENLISEWRTFTPISQINQQAGLSAITVNEEVFQLTKRAITYSNMTNGAFDISTAAMDKIWKFDGSMVFLPTDSIIQRSIRNVDFRNIILDSTTNTIFLQKQGMKIGFGSIGKGYAADKARELLQSLGVSAGIVNASGDIATWGLQADKKPWLIGIRNPFKRNKVVKILALKHDAVATSGSYEKYVEIDNVRYSHIINPKTGMPATGLTSVTIYGPSAEFANALSTSIMVLGAKKGKKLIKLYPDYKFLFITDKGKIIKR